MEDWVALYKIGRLALLAFILCGIAVYLYAGPNRNRFEEPAIRMLEEDDG